MLTRHILFQTPPSSDTKEPPEDLGKLTWRKVPVIVTFSDPSVPFTLGMALEGQIVVDPSFLFDMFVGKINLNKH
jgi:hypothetical protein